MDTLHILNKSPDHTRFSRCLAAVAPEDGLLLTENAVLAVTGGFTFNTAQVYSLGSDVQARGLEHHGTGVSRVDFNGMVDLTTRARRIISW